MKKAVFLTFLSLTVSIFLLRLNVKPDITFTFFKKFKIKVLDGPFLFDSRNLYAYLDGGADFYIKNGLSHLKSFELKSKSVSFTFEIYTFKNLGGGLKIFKKETSKKFERGKGVYIFSKRDVILLLKGRKMVKIIFYGSVESSFKNEIISYLESNL